MKIKTIFYEDCTGTDTVKEIGLISYTINFSICMFSHCNLLISSRTNEIWFPQELCPVFPEPIGSCAISSLNLSQLLWATVLLSVIGCRFRFPFIHSYWFLRWRDTWHPWDLCKDLWLLLKLAGGWKVTLWSLAPWPLPFRHLIQVILERHTVTVKTADFKKQSLATTKIQTCLNFRVVI